MNTPIIRVVKEDEQVVVDKEYLRSLLPTATEIMEQQGHEYDQETWKKLQLAKRGRIWVKSGKIYVPEKLRSRLIAAYHCGENAVHQGVSRTYGAIKRHYWWPLMKKGIASQLRECLFCRRRRYLMGRYRFCPGP